MKWFLIFWAGPVAFLASWYWLSYYDMSFGIFMFSRQVHDLTFELYGQMLGLPPEDLPALVARAIAVDSLFVIALLAFRRRAKIAAWWKGRQTPRREDSARPESLSSAP